MQHETFNTKNNILIGTNRNDTSESQGGISSPQMNQGASMPLGLVTC
jgi:hypothetical protein